MMQFMCQQQDLSRGLSAVSRAISSKPTLPILTNILVATDQGRLRLSATNLEISIIYWINAQIQGEGIIAVPAKPMTDYVENLPPAPVKISTLEASRRIRLMSPYTTAHIKGADPDEFPRIPDNVGASELPVTLDAKLLRHMISSVVIAASTDASRPVFTGVLVQFGREALTLTATDSNRLTIHSTTLAQAAIPQPDVIVPAPALKELARILPLQGQVAIGITPSRNQVVFYSRPIRFISRLIEGAFPDYRQLLPTQYITRAVIATSEFANALKGAALFTEDRSHLIWLKFSPAKKNLTIKASAADLGDYQRIIAAHIQGTEYEVAFNVHYLQEVVAVIEAPQVAIELTTLTQPVIIRPIDQHNYLYAVMPLHIQT